MQFNVWQLYLKALKSAQNHTNFQFASIYYNIEWEKLSTKGLHIAWYFFVEQKTKIKVCFSGTNLHAKIKPWRDQKRKGREGRGGYTSHHQPKQGLQYEYCTKVLFTGEVLKRKQRWFIFLEEKIHPWGKHTYTARIMMRKLHDIYSKKIAFENYKEMNK